MAPPPDYLASFTQYVIDHPGKSLGPWLLGALADFALMGVLTMMGVEYFVRYPRDTRWIRILVCATLFMNVLRCVQSAAIVWTRFITQAMVPLPFLWSSWYAEATFFSSEFIAWTAQTYFVHRLYQLSGRRKLPVLLTVPVIAVGFISTLLYTTLSYLYPDHPNLLNANNIFIAFSFGGIICGDLLVTGFTLYYLSRARADAGKHNVRGLRVPTLLVNLTRLTWMTAAPPAVAVMLNTIVYFVASGSQDTGAQVCVFFNFLMPKLYSISLLYTLNVRRNLREHSDLDVGISTIQPASVSSPSGGRSMAFAAGGRRRANSLPSDFSFSEHMLFTARGSVYCDENDDDEKPVRDGGAQTWAGMTLRTPRTREWLSAPGGGEKV